MIRFNNVRKTYPNGTQALKGLSFELKDGEFAFLVGPSGAGKSTILSLLTAEEPISGGSLMVNGYNLNTIRPGQVPYLRRSLGIVFQDFRLIPKKTVYENMAFAMRVVGASPREMRRRIPYVLDLVGLTGKENNMPDELSGGEQQRVAIARALVNNPSTIIADEPTGNLDPDRSMEIMSLLERINALGTTMLVVTHEKGLVNHFNKRVIHIEDGVVASDEEDGFYIYGDDNKETDAETAEAQEQYFPLLRQRGLQGPVQPRLYVRRRNYHHRRLPADHPHRYTASSHP